MGHRALLAYRRDDTDDDSTATTGDSTDATGTPADESADSTDSTDATLDRRDDADEDAPPDATYDLHRSHWGAADFALLGHLSAESPFASETAFAVDPEPVATDLSLAEIVGDHLDFLHHEAFYRVSSDYETTAFHVLWFGLEPDCEAIERSETVGHGALVEAHPDDADFVRGWFRGAKEVVGAMVDRGALTPEEAADCLAERVESWAADREVILPE